MAVRTEPYKNPHGNVADRWEVSGMVRFSAVTRQKLLDVLGENVEDREATDPGRPHAGPIEGARCAPLGIRLYHSDMGHPCEVWTVVDAIPSIKSEPGDLLFFCPAATHGRLGKAGTDPWPTPYAIMYPDESTYTAFLTDDHWRELYFPVDDAPVEV